MLGAARVARACVLLLACLCLFACQALVGGFDVSDQAESGCDDNRFRCVNELLYCVRTEGGEEALTLITRCNSAEECDSTAGRCTVCEMGEFRCNREKVESCNATQSGWTLKKPCESAELCNVASGDCRTCAAGEVQCSGSDQRELQICSENGTWGPPLACDTKELCDASAAAIVADPNAPKECLVANCPINAYQCINEVELQRCPAGQAGWVTTDRCASPELCRITAETPGLADANGTKCEPPVCQPNDFRCVGNTLEQCNQDLLGFGVSDECVAPLQCNTNLKACTDACTPGEGQCNGNVVEVCSATQMWEPFDTCENAGLCRSTPNSDGTFGAACDEPQCEGGAFRCTGNQLQHCRADRSGWDSTECASEALCNAQDGICEPPACTDPTAFRCNPTQPLELQVCRADFTGWDPVQVCASTQSCNPSGTPPCIDECPDPPYRCTGNIRQVCSGDTGAPVWTAETTCPTEELCRCVLSPDASECLNGVDDTGQCGNPVCDAMPATVRCSGNFLQSCQPGRNGWNSTQECTIGCKDSATGADYCALCRANDAECAGSGIRYCNAGTGLFDAATSCPLNACMVVSGADYCAQCTSGNAECVNGTQLRTCNASSRLWNNPTNCALGCREGSPVDYCAQCSPGDAECSGSQLRTCDPNTRTWISAPCSLACMTVSDGPDYCAVCSAGDAECNGDDLRTCNASTRLWTSSECDLACMTVSGGPDYCAVCSAGDAECSGDDLRTCNATTRLWSSSECDLACMTVSGGPDYCAVCSAGDAECSGDDLRTCNASTRLWSSSPCTLACMTVSGGADYCAQCTAGDPAECSGDDLRTCNASTRLWTSSPCTLACMQDAGGADYCAQCSTGQTRCVTEGLETCDTVSRRWGTAGSCTFGCYGTEPSAYCGDCDGPEDCTSPTALCVAGRCEEPMSVQ